MELKKRFGIWSAIRNTVTFKLQASLSGSFVLKTAALWLRNTLIQINAIYNQLPLSLFSLSQQKLSLL